MFSLHCWSIFHETFPFEVYCIPARIMFYLRLAFRIYQRDLVSVNIAVDVNKPKIHNKSFGLLKKTT